MDIRNRNRVPSVRKIIFKRSRNNMAKMLNHLQIRLKRTPEVDLTMRDWLIRRIELLRIIRIDMKAAMREM
jgi:hypothetical protein